MSSGQIELYGEIDDWESVLSYLSKKVNTEEDSEDADVDWASSNWGWGSDDISENTKQLASDSNQSDNIASSVDANLTSLFDNFVIAYSPIGDALAIASGSKAVFFASKCHINTDRVKYLKSFEGILSEEEGEVITSITCIPLISQKRSSPGAPDWTCFVVGFNRGYVRIYTETGSLLVAQQFHNERVQSFKVRSFVQSRISLQHDQLEELIVVYRTVLVSLDGFGLFQTLRGCRNHLARMKANATETDIDPPLLSSKKWGFENDQTVSDCDTVGLNTPSTFDHLYTASLLGGFNATPKLNPPTANIFTTVGHKPFIAFHHAQENQAPPVLTEMAYAVASKVKTSIVSAATGWLGFGGISSFATSKPVKEVKTFEVATPLFLRAGLADVRRSGKSILCSPDRNLSVATDGLGRVTLIENSTGLAVRMWKGYRDAQCAWFQAEEHLSSSKGRARDKDGRIALFLVIYAPRRERLEVFAMQQGPKVSCFEVKKSGRLLSATFGMMGLSSIQQQKGRNKPNVECMFVDIDGQLFTLNIPFHLGLCDKGSRKVKDLHLLKALQKLLRDGQYTAETILQVLTQLRTQGMINQGFRVLTQKCEKTKILQELLNTYSSKYCDDDEKDLTVLFRIGSLLELYQSLMIAQAMPPAYTLHENEDASDDKSLLFCLHSSQKEMSFLEKMAAEDLDGNQTKTKAVTFESDTRDWNLNEFFGCFTIEYDPNKIKASITSGIGVNFKYDEIEKFGELLFCGCLNGTTDLEEWKQKLRNASLESSAILLLAFKYWCQNTMLNKSYVTFMERLYHVIKTLCDLEGYESVMSEFNQVSKWWEDIRKEITSCDLLLPIYTFSIVCRAVSIELQQQRQDLPEKSSIPNNEPDDVNNGATSSAVEIPSTSLESEFENMSLDLLKWNILLKQIEDLSLLSSVLMQKPHLNSSPLPVLKREDDSLTVIKLLDKGKGCIAELVGRWLTTIGIAPQFITAAFEGYPSASNPAKIEDLPNVPEIEGGIEALEVDKSSDRVLDLLKTLQENFSISLSSSIILSNYCWEYCLEWKNETDNVEYFEAAIKCASAISSPYIRQGMISMMWTIFVSKKFSAVVAISKTSREKLADKTGGFSSAEKKLKFLDYCVQFLDLFLDASGACNGTCPPEHSTRKNHWSSEVNSNASLTDLALLQPLPNFDMIMLHYQLALCAQFFYTFRLKGTMKPTNFFDTKSSMLLFQNMQNPTPFSHYEVDLALKQLREQFLCHTIRGAIQSISEEWKDSTSSPVYSPNSPQEIKDEQIAPTEKGVRECESWLNKCLDLGRTWRMELDFLRTAYAVELYSSGFDLLGEEAIGSVQGRDVLGSKLLYIAGLRASYVINQRRDNVTDIIASVSTNLSKWLESMEYINLRSLRFRKNSIKEMLVHTLQLIPESSYDYKLAEELLQLCSII